MVSGVAGLLLIILAPRGLAQSSSSPWVLELSLTALYDDNVLKYSDKYLGRFERGEDPGRFHIRTTDDLVMEPALRFAWRFSFIRRRSTEFSISTRLRGYSQNDVKNWAWYRVHLRQVVDPKTSAQAWYAYIPHFYVRHYRDEDWVRAFGYTADTFKPFSFSKDELGVGIQHRLFNDTRIGGTFMYMRYFHNAHFTEYDAHNSVWRVELLQVLTRNVRLGVAYSHASSGAKGYDEPGETSAIADDADASYNEHKATGEIIYTLPQLLKKSNNVRLQGSYSRRSFTSRRSVEDDPLHVGRRDHEYEMTLKYTMWLSSGLSIAALYTWSKRDAGTQGGPNDAFVSDEKGFAQHQAGVELTYLIRM